jgi:hypothetical protein
MHSNYTSKKNDRSAYLMAYMLAKDQSFLFVHNVHGACYI